MYMNIYIYTVHAIENGPTGLGRLGFRVWLSIRCEKIDRQI